jgi:2,3-dihydroxybiphenyl 1,2-dioxygenase
MSDLKSLGYITVSTADVDRWRHFAFGVLGFAEGKGPDPSALYLRMDERAARIIVVPGETDRVLTIGWEVRDHAALQRVTAALDRAAVAFKRLSVDEAGDPSGTTLEVFHGAVLDHSPVITPFGAKFVTGDQGLGHVVVPATDPNAMFDFYTDVLGFRSRGAFRVPLPKEFGPVRVRFLGINERHHSMAIVPAAHQRDPGVVHVMVEVYTLDAVGPDQRRRHSVVVHPRPPHQRQDGVVLRPRTRRLGHRVRYRWYAGRRNLLHRRGNHRR